MLDDFRGDTVAYVAYLENQLKIARRLHKRCRHCASPRASTARWEVCATALIKEVPEANDWKDILSTKGIYTAMQDETTLAYLLCQDDVPTQATMLPPRSCSTIVDHMTRYAQVTASRQSQAHLALLLANFQEFVLLSACFALKALGKMTTEEAYTVVRICRGNIKDEHCRRLLSTVRFINVLVDTLAQHGWDGRAAELLLLWNRPASYYYHMAKSPKESLALLKSELSTAKLTTNAESWPKSRSVFVPMLICELLGQDVHIVSISHELGYAHAHLFDDDLVFVNPLHVLSS